MNIKISTKQMLGILLIIAWILFVGLCIEAGGFLFNAVFALVKPEASGRLWQQVDLSSLFQFDKGYFAVITFTMCIAAAMKALIFYLIIKIIHEKKLDLAQPFNNDVRRCIAGIAYLALLIGLFSLSGEKYVEWLVTKGVQMPGIQYMRLTGADVWLFMSVILFVIAQVFKRGIDIQSENELTV